MSYMYLWCRFNNDDALSWLIELDCWVFFQMFAGVLRSSGTYKHMELFDAAEKFEVCMLFLANPDLCACDPPLAMTSMTCG